MTREQALEKVSAIFQSKISEREMADFVDALEALGAVKFDRSGALDCLVLALRGTVLPFFSGTRQFVGTGQLDERGVSAVLVEIDRAGLKLVPK